MDVFGGTCGEQSPQSPEIDSQRDEFVACIEPDPTGFWPPEPTGEPIVGQYAQVQGFMSLIEGEPIELPRDAGAFAQLLPGETFSPERAFPTPDALAYCGERKDPSDAAMQTLLIEWQAAAASGDEAAIELFAERHPFAAVGSFDLM